MIESVLLVMRMVLEYFGVDSDSLQDWLTQNRDQRMRKRRRSIVRVIGSHLPLKPCKRVYFNIDLQDVRASERRGWKPVFFEEDSEPLVVSSLADIKWLSNISPDKHIRMRSEYWPSRAKRTKAKVRPSILPKESASITPIPEHDTMDTHPAVMATPDPSALTKISALEEELAKLRAQIAMIVSTQAQQQQIPATPVTGFTPNCIPGIETPPLTPTCPRFAPPPPAPPPPPPPPPPPSLLMPKQMSISEIIKKNKAAKGETKGAKTPNTPAGMPNMADVLKGLGSVKLKSIARSPGGTPIRQAPKPSDSDDPAALIARALKKKFAHRRVMDSPPVGKENEHGFTPSPQNSPMKASPKFGRHLLKPCNSRRSLDHHHATSPLTNVNA